MHTLTLKRATLLSREPKTRGHMPQKGQTFTPGYPEERIHSPKQGWRAHSVQGSFLGYSPVHRETPQLQTCCSRTVLLSAPFIAQPGVNWGHAQQLCGWGAGAVFVVSCCLAAPGTIHCVKMCFSVAVPQKLN